MPALAHPPLDDFTELYLRLALQLERHIEGYVDAYFGPPQLKEQVLAEEKPSPKVLAKSTTQLRQQLDDASYDDRRKDYLQKQVHAMETVVNKLNGVKSPFLGEVEGYFDLKPDRPNEQAFLTALETLDDLFPGTGLLTERYESYRMQFEIPSDKQLQVLQLAAAEVENRTKGTIIGSELPEYEELELTIVKDRPWSAFNWYLGQAKSKIEFNVDLPLSGLSVIDTMAHETYPGHHLEHAVKENLLYYQKGYGENSVLLTLAPESLVSEGVANYGRELIYTRREALEWAVDRIFPLLPRQPEINVEAEIEISNALRAYDSLGGFLAFLLYVDGSSKEDCVKIALEHTPLTEERIQAYLKFILDPLWRSYIFNYYLGESLVETYVERGDKVKRFQSLLQQQFWPSLLAQG
ncbi:MAG: hypothetical protein ACE5OZ_21150 [Candidatus Heimdallarchaeota archaeon]